MYGQESTRPRIVDVPPVTPGFNPNEPPPIDVQALIQQLMQPAPQQVQPQDKLGGILQAIAGGVGVGISNDPGQALMQQVEGLKQRNFAAEQAKKQREDDLLRMNRQFGLTLARDQIGNQQDIAKEKRTQEYKKLDREANFDDYIKKNAVDFQTTTELKKQEREWRKADAILQHQWDLEKDQKQDDKFYYQQNRLENKDLFDKKISLISAGLPAGLANTIASKMFNGENLSPTESKAITAAAQRSLRPSGRSTSSGSSGIPGMTEKQKFQYLNVRMKDQFVKVQMPDGSTSIVEMSNAPKDMMGNIVGLQGIASDAEKMRKLSDEIEAIDSIRGKKISGNGNTLIPTKISLEAKWDGIVRQMKSQGDTDSQIANEIQVFLQKNPNATNEEIDAINNAIVRTKGNRPVSSNKPEPPKETRVIQQVGSKLLELLGRAVSK